MITQSPFGRTGHLSTRALFGAASLSRVTQAEADRTLDLLLQYGVNHIDTAFSYGDSELRIGPWMKRYRKEFFLATKTGERTYEKAREGIHRSLDRLQTDHVDLIQFHHLVEPDEWEVALGSGGALEAAVEAREQGLVRFIGVTGHEIAIAEMHLRSLARFDFDSVLLPYNYPIMQNPQYAANFERVVGICRERNAAVQAIKGIQRRAWGDRTPTRARGTSRWRNKLPSIWLSATSWAGLAFSSTPSATSTSCRRFWTPPAGSSVHHQRRRCRR